MPSAAARAQPEGRPSGTPTARTLPASPTGASRRALAELAKERIRQYGAPQAGEVPPRAAEALVGGRPLSQQPVKGTAGDAELNHIGRRQGAAAIPGALRGFARQAAESHV